MKNRTDNRKQAMAFFLRRNRRQIILVIGISTLCAVFCAAIFNEASATETSDKIIIRKNEQLNIVNNLFTPLCRFRFPVNDENKPTEGEKKKLNACNLNAQFIFPWLSAAAALLIAGIWIRHWYRRKYALGQGRFRVVLLCAVFFVVHIYSNVLISMERGMGVGPKKPAASEKPIENNSKGKRVAKREKETSEDKDDIPHTTDIQKENQVAKQGGKAPEDNLPAFQKLQLEEKYKEINQKLESEQHMYILKFTMIGAMLAVLFQFITTRRRMKPPFGDSIRDLKKSNTAAMFFWAAVIVNCIIDTRICRQAAVMTAIGNWIKEHEARIDGIGWETWMDQHGFYTVSPSMQLNNSVLTTVLFTLTAFLFIVRDRYGSHRGQMPEDLKVTNQFLGIFAMVLMYIGATGSNQFYLGWTVPALLWIAAGVLVFLLAPVKVTRTVFQYPEISPSLIGLAFPFHYLSFPPGTLLRYLQIEPNVTPSRQEVAEETFHCTHLRSTIYQLERFVLKNKLKTEEAYLNDSKELFPLTEQLKAWIARHLKEAPFPYRNADGSTETSPLSYWSFDGTMEYYYKISSDIYEPLEWWHMILAVPVDSTRREEVSIISFKNYDPPHRLLKRTATWSLNP